MKLTRTQAQRGRGSVLVLVVIVLVLMSMLGMAYIQVARMDRIATQALESGNIDVVAKATLLYVGEILRGDVVDRNNYFFNPTSSLSGTTQTGYDEPYDYPWTSTNTFSITLADGTTDTARGGQLDDAWLASTTPDFDTDPDEPRWKHVSNLNLIGVRIPKTGGSYAAPDSTNAGEYALDGGTLPDGTPASDSDLIITGSTLSSAMMEYSSSDWEPYGVDADADGIADSIWTWAPIRQISGTRYVMAVRIVDNSALLNLNSATLLHGSGQATAPDATSHPDARDLPRGLTVCDADLARLLARWKPSDPATWASEWQDVLTNLRSLTINGSGLVPTDVTGLDLSTWPTSGSWAAGGRVGDYLDRVRYFLNYSSALPSIQDELELRYCNGLNNVDTNYTLETRLANLLRGSATESTYADIDYTDTGAGTAVQEMQAYFQGGSSSSPGDPTASIESRAFPALRHQLTTRSGSVMYAPNAQASVANHSITGPYYRRWRYDLTHQDAADPTARGAAIYDRIYNVLSKAANATTGAYLGLNLSVPADVELLQQIAKEYTLAVLDYTDSDLNPSSTAGTISSVSVNFYGMERLPFLREAYVQAGYTEIDNMDAAGVKVGDPGYTAADNTYDTWQVVAGSNAVVVELGNPFEQEIDLGANTPPVRVVVMQGGVEISTVDLSSTSLTLAPRDPTGASDTDEQAVLYTNPGTPITEDGGSEGANVLADLEVDALVNASQKAAIALAFNADGTDITLALQVDVSGSGTWVTYDKLTVPGFNVPATVDFPSSADWVAFVTGPPNVPLARFRHYQASVKRDGQEIRYLSNLNAAASTRTPNTPNYARRGAGSNVDQLWLDAKGIAGDNRLDNLQIPVPNRPMLSVAELAWLFMAGFHDGTDGDLPTRLESGDLSNNLRWNLQIDSTATVSTYGIDHLRVPHAAMLLDQFTTISPRFDGVDNDNNDGDNNTASGADNNEEQFVPGKININTAPRHLLTLAAPLPESIDDVEALMTQIAAYRDLKKLDGTAVTRSTMTSLAGTLRANPGVAHLGELLFVNPSSPATPGVPGTAAADAVYMQRYGANAAAENLDNGDPTDMYPVPETTAADPTIKRYNLIDSAEERVSRYQFLSEVFRTRSDVFTAYIYIRGYPAGDFRSGPVEARRLLAVFDRSGLVQGNEAVKILGVYEFPN